MVDRRTHDLHLLLKKLTFPGESLVFHLELIGLFLVRFPNTLMISKLLIFGLKMLVLTEDSIMVSFNRIHASLEIVVDGSQVLALSINFGDIFFHHETTLDFNVKLMVELLLLLDDHIDMVGRRYAVWLLIVRV